MNMTLTSELADDLLSHYLLHDELKNLLKDILYESFAFDDDSKSAHNLYKTFRRACYYASRMPRRPEWYEDAKLDLEVARDQMNKIED